MFKAKLSQAKPTETDQMHQRADTTEKDKAPAEAKSAMSSPPAYDAMAQDNSLQIIIRDKQGASHGPVHEYFLAASSPVFRDMLFSGNNKQRNVLFLPEPFEDIDNLIKVITDNAVPSTTSFPTVKQASVFTAWRENVTLSRATCIGSGHSRQDTSEKTLSNFLRPLASLCPAIYGSQPPPSKPSSHLHTTLSTTNPEAASSAICILPA